MAAGDLVDRGFVAAVAPLAGEEVFAEALLEDGSTLTLHLKTDDAGNVREISEYEEHEDPAPVDAIYAAAPGCGTTSHSLTGFRWNTTYDWYFNAASTPSYLGTEYVIGALRRAGNNIIGSDNTCGLGDQVGFTAQYQGIRDVAANVSATGGCTEADGLNVTGFGDLRAGILAVTCTWSAAGIARESDARINKADYLWYAELWSGCTRSYGIEAVMTHERGHTAGLGHSTGTGQTMFPSLGPCSDSAATLGSGDIAGLRRIY
ncbi:MAG: matrixin family metalloprotease [Deltaproteobacteria bacterium]|nr:matrixin family metalloprotease [Deltaproteobacteria bacterium]